MHAHDMPANFLALLGRLFPTFLALLSHDHATLDALLTGLGEFVAADRAILVGVEPIEGGVRIADGAVQPVEVVLSIVTLKVDWKSPVILVTLSTVRPSKTQSASTVVVSPTRLTSYLEHFSAWSALLEAAIVRSISLSMHMVIICSRGPKPSSITVFISQRPALRIGSSAATSTSSRPSPTPQPRT